MACNLWNFGLGFLAKDEESIVKLFNFINSDGKIIVGYGGGYYTNQNYGDVQLILRNVIREDTKSIEIMGLDTHSVGNSIWDMRVSLGTINSEDEEKDISKCLCMLKKADDGTGIIVTHIVNANVLPSYLEDDYIRLQMIALAVDTHYYADENAYVNAQPDDSNGRKWLISDGTIFPSGFMFNHDPDREEKEKNYDLDDRVLVKGTVKELYHGKTKFGDIEKNSYIRCFIDTSYGTLEIVHTLDQISEAERANIRVGSIVSGLCVLSGNAAICDYENGAIFDEEHNLRALRYAIVTGEPERMEFSFTPDADYISVSPSKEFKGRKSIIEYMRHVSDTNKTEGKKYFAYMASICSIDDDGKTRPDYPVGKRCVILANGEEHSYESIAFIDVNVEGKITRLVLSTDSRYHFSIDKKPEYPIIYHDVKFPKNVLEPILFRARFHGIIDDYVQDSDVLDYHEEYWSYKNNADITIKALEECQLMTDEKVLANVFGYLFAKEIERIGNITEDNSRGGLLLSFSPEEAFSGEIRTFQESEAREKIVKSMNLGRQFYKDFKYFSERGASNNEQFIDNLSLSLITVQRLGAFYSKKIFNRGNNDVLSPTI